MVCYVCSCYYKHKAVVHESCYEQIKMDNNKLILHRMEAVTGVQSWQRAWCELDLWRRPTDHYLLCVWRRPHRFASGFSLVHFILLLRNFQGWDCIMIPETWQPVIRVAWLAPLPRWLYVWQMQNKYLCLFCTVPVSSLFLPLPPLQS